MGTTGMWRPHGDNMETTWGPQGCGDHVGTTWRQHGDNMETWGQHEDNVETTLGQHGGHRDVERLSGHRHAMNLFIDKGGCRGIIMPRFINIHEHP